MKISKLKFVLLLCVILGSMSALESCKKMEVQPEISDAVNTSPELMQWNTWGKFTNWNCKQFNITCLKPVIVTPAFSAEMMGICGDLNATSQFFTDNALVFDNVISDEIINGLQNNTYGLNHKVSHDGENYFAVFNIEDDSDLFVLTVTTD